VNECKQAPAAGAAPNMPPPAGAGDAAPPPKPPAPPAACGPRPAAKLGAAAAPPKPGVLAGAPNGCAAATRWGQKSQFESSKNDHAGGRVSGGGGGGRRRLEPGCRHLLAASITTLHLDRMTLKYDVRALASLARQ